MCYHHLPNKIISAITKLYLPFPTHTLNLLNHSTNLSNNFTIFRCCFALLLLLSMAITIECALNIYFLNTKTIPHAVSIVFRSAGANYWDLFIHTILLICWMAFWVNGLICFWRGIYRTHELLRLLTNWNFILEKIYEILLIN